MYTCMGTVQRVFSHINIRADTTRGDGRVNLAAPFPSTPPPNTRGPSAYSLFSATTAGASRGVILSERARTRPTTTTTTIIIINNVNLTRGKNGPSTLSSYSWLWWTCYCNIKACITAHYQQGSLMSV